MLVILSGVAGAGKDTIKKELLKRMENVETLPSFTDRPPREGDIPGQTYNFVTTEEFEGMIKNNELYEYSVHHNHYYGTAKKLLNDKINSGKIIVKDIEVNGTQALIDLLKNEIDKSFYTSSMNFNDEDFDDIKEIKNIIIKLKINKIINKLSYQKSFM